MIIFQMLVTVFAVIIGIKRNKNDSMRMFAV